MQCNTRGHGEDRPEVETTVSSELEVELDAKFKRQPQGNGEEGGDKWVHYWVEGKYFELPWTPIVV